MVKILLIGGPKDGGAIEVRELPPYIEFVATPRTPVSTFHPVNPPDKIMDINYRTVRYKKRPHPYCPVYDYVD